MVLSYITSPAYHMVEERTDRYQAAKFEEGHYIQIEVAGMLKASQNQDLARSSCRSHSRRVSVDHPDNELDDARRGNLHAPAGGFFQTAQPDKTFLMPSEEVAKNRQAWIREWQTAMSANNRRKAG